MLFLLTSRGTEIISFTIQFFTEVYQLRHEHDDDQLDKEKKAGQQLQRNLHPTLPTSSTCHLRLERHCFSLQDGSSFRQRHHSS